MLRRSRKGIALIAVVLIASLVFASIVGIVASVVPENKMIAARSASQRALTAAESGMSQTLFNLRNADFIDGTTAPVGGVEYLTIGDVASLMSSTPGSRFLYPDFPVSGGTTTPYVTYQIVIVKSSGQYDPTNMPPNPAPVGLSIYSLGTVRVTQGGTILARKPIQLTVAAIVSNVIGAPVRYGIVAGASVDFSSSGNRVSYSDVWVGGDVTRDNQGNNSGIVDHGIVYATGSVETGVVDPATSTTVEGAPSPNDTLDAIFLKLNTLYTKARALAFYSGTAPYDGTVADYPNTSRSGLSNEDAATVNAIFTHYLGDGQGNVSFGNVAGFFPALISNSVYNPTGTAFTSGVSGFLSNLESFAKVRETANEIVCYYNAPPGNNQNGVVTSTDLSKSPVSDNLGGTIIINGDLSITSSAIVNPGTTVYPTGNPLILRVTGNVGLNGGTVNANVYASGEIAVVKKNTPAVAAGNCTLNGYLITPADISVTGSFNVVGSILTKQNVYISGSVDVTYKDTGLGTISMPSSSQLTAKASEGTWREISLDAFNLVKP